MGEEVVVPGEFIGTEEEYLAGRGTFVVDGKIFASVCGQLHIDQKRRASVVAFESIPEARRGDIVYGRVVEIFESVAFVEVEISLKNKKEKTIVLPGVIPVSEIKMEYVRSIRDELRVGDVVKGTIVRITPFRLEISLKGRDMGVVKAYCKVCRNELKLRGRDLVCENCGHHESRKLAFPYGKFEK